VDELISEFERDPSSPIDWGSTFEADFTLDETYVPLKRKRFRAQARLLDKLHKALLDKTKSLTLWTPK
jgi:hypothetical protein